jgi:hypothetical protein
VLAHVLQFLSAALRAIIFDGWRALVALSYMFTATLRRCRTLRELTHNQKSRDPSHCSPIRRPEFKRPDPLIYSQNYLMSLGLAVTWDNPDITLEKPSGPLLPNAPPNPAQTVPSSALLPDTEYDVVARIWNGSTAAPVVGLPVMFKFFGFGIGTLGQVIGNAVTNLGVKGGPGCPAYARVRWRTPNTLGHYCIQVFLDWFDDLNPANNLGQENTNVGTAHSAAQFTFKLRNARGERQPFRFVADAYSIGEAISCAQVDREREKAERERRRRERLDARQPAVASQPETFSRLPIPERHAWGARPVSAGWAVAIEPESPVLAGGEEIDVKVTITSPGSFSGRQTINVHAFDASPFISIKCEVRRWPMFSTPNV